MGRMSDLHLLSGRALDGEAIPAIAEGTTYPIEEIAWATAERLRSGDHSQDYEPVEL